jgi:hypothetical protein
MILPSAIQLRSLGALIPYDEYERASQRLDRLAEKLIALRLRVAEAVARGDLPASANREVDALDEAYDRLYDRLGTLEDSERDAWYRDLRALEARIDSFEASRAEEVRESYWTERFRLGFWVSVAILAAGGIAYYTMKKSEGVMVGNVPGGSSAPSVPGSNCAVTPIPSGRARAIRRGTRKYCIINDEGRTIRCFTEERVAKGLVRRLGRGFHMEVR